MWSEAPVSETVYERFDNSADFQAAVDRLLEQPGRELRIFDPDLSALRLNEPGRVERLARFLLASRTRPMQQPAPRRGAATSSSVGFLLG